MKDPFSFSRLWAIVVKEFIQMGRDKITFAMMLFMTLFQLTLYGFAINTNPRHLPTAIIAGDQSPITRTFITAMENTKYFKIVAPNIDQKQAEHLLARGDIQNIVYIPPNFSEQLIQGHKPSILVTTDGTDPIATARVTGTLAGLAHKVFDLDLSRGASNLIATSEPYNLIIHAKYNPEGITEYNTVPGLMGTILTMTMIMITGLAITREYERGTMEGLLAMPIRPLEIIIGKILPFVIIGYAQQILIIALSMFIFKIPIIGSIGLLLLATLPFIAANLSIGLTFSTIAKNQLQAVQMTFFFFLPSILLSGFLFPFKGMPVWAQMIGEILPLTHFLRITRGILLKGNGIMEIWPNVWPILAFMIVAVIIASRRYRQTLD